MLSYSIPSFSVITVQLQLCGLIGMVSHPYMQKIWEIGFFFESSLQRQFDVEKKFYKQLF